MGGAAVALAARRTRKKGASRKGMAACYNKGVRLRWTEVVIVLSLVGITVAGIATLWGSDIARLWRDEKSAERVGPRGAPPGDGVGSGHPTR